MTWPFENNTNGIVKNLAKRNLKSEKRRNVMVIVSVVLSAFLISLSGLTGVSLMQTEKKKVIDTYEATYVQVDETHIEELREVPEFARVGEYYRYGEEVSAQGFKGFFAYTDKETLYMARSQMNLADGDLPEEKNEIVVSKEWLSKFFPDCHIGDSVTLDTESFSGEYTISGILDTTGQEKQNMYSFLISKEMLKQCTKYEPDGYFAYVHLKHWKPQIGDTVTFNFKNHSGKTITKAFKIGAITSSNDGMGGYIFRMPENMLKELAGYDCTYAIEIQAEAEYQEIIEQELKLLVSDNRDVRLQTLQDFIVEHQSDNRAGFTLAYAIAAILWIFAVINQINLTVTNLLSQKQEMGTLKSIGMTNKQLKQAFMMEGLFTTLIALLITAVVGIPGGYAIGIFLKNAGMSTGFVFPVVAFTLFAVAMFMLESLMTILLIHSWKKQSVIAIMRN